MSEDNKRYFSLFPKALAGCVEPLLRPVLKAQGLAGSRILTEWDNIVGPSLARHTYPEKLAFPKGKKTGGTLTISTESGFATELQHMQPVILERLAGYFGYMAIERIVFSHTWVPARHDRKLPAPKPTLTAASAELAGEVEDGELKDALQSLARTLSGQAT